MMSRRTNLHSSDHNFSLQENYQPVADYARDSIKFFPVEELQKIFPSPTVITTENLRQIVSESKEPVFEEILGQNDGRYFFKQAKHRDCFLEFIDNQSSKISFIRNTIKILPLSSEQYCDKILKFKFLSKINDSFIIAISVIELAKIVPIDPIVMRDLFGMTLAESRIAISLQNGFSVTDAADQIGVRVSTVRDQLSSIFAKTATSRQSELISLLSRLELVMA